MISAMLLAAGESRRMGDFKQLLRLGNKSFVEHCVDNLLASRVGEVIVVTGHRQSEVESVLANRRVIFAHNSEHKSGMTSSIKRGLHALSEGSDACVIALVDQPRIDPNVINRIIETFENTHPLVVIPTYLGKNGHPILLDKKLKDDVLNLDISLGLRQVVHSHVDETAHIEVFDQGVLEDCDLPEDYQRLLRQ